MTRMMRMMTLSQEKTNWVTYNLAGLYWRMKGDAFESIECLRYIITTIIIIIPIFSVDIIIPIVTISIMMTMIIVTAILRRAIHFGEEERSREARPVSLIR